MLVWGGFQGTGPLSAQSLINRDFNVNTHLKISTLTEAKAPEIWNDQIIMTFVPKERVYYAAVSFAHEGYRYQHVFQINKHQVFFLFYPLPEADGPLHYRLIVDGVWMADPVNPQTTRDPQGLQISRLEIPLLRDRRVTSPYRLSDGLVEFAFKGSPGQRVALVGNFNNWDPFMTPLEEDPFRPGHFSIRIDLPPGPQYYNFVTGMDTVTDPTNPKIHWNQRGQPVSYFVHERP